jgi:hypothetical protein
MSNNVTITPDQLRTVLTATEIGNDLDKLNTFTWARKGNSTYSFGLMQFDAGNNSAVQQFLLDNGFNQKQIDKLSQHRSLKKSDLASLNAQLQAIPQDKMDDFTNSQLQDSVARIDSVIDAVRATNPAAAKIITNSPELQLRIADYDNQYPIDSKGGSNTIVDTNSPIVRYLSGAKVNFQMGGSMQLPQGKTLAADDFHIQDFINHSNYNAKYATTHHDHGHSHGHNVNPNRPDVNSRAERLNAAISQLGLGTPPQDTRQQSQTPDNASPAPTPREDPRGPRTDSSQGSPNSPNRASPLMDPDLQAIYNSNGDPAVMEQSAENYRNSPSGELFDMQAQAAAARVQPGAPAQQAAEPPRVQQSGPSIG